MDPQQLTQPIATGLLLWTRLAGDIDRLLRSRRSAAGECGQCHVVDVPEKLNTDLLLIGRRNGLA